MFSCFFKKKPIKEFPDFTKPIVDNKPLLISTELMPIIENSNHKAK